MQVGDEATEIAWTNQSAANPMNPRSVLIFDLFSILDWNDLAESREMSANRVASGCCTRYLVPLRGHRYFFLMISPTRGLFGGTRTLLAWVL